MFSWRTTQVHEKTKFLIDIKAMKRKCLYLLAAMFVMMGTACTEDSEGLAEDLAKRFCDCNKIEDVEKREKCIDKINYELQFHLSDFEFMAAYNRASQACYN